MSQALKFLVFLYCCTCASTVFAASQSPQVEQLYVVAGLDTRLKSMALFIQNELDKSKTQIIAQTGISEEAWLTLKAGLKQAYSHESIKDSVLKEMNTTISQAMLETNLAEYGKEHMQRIVREEKEASTKEGAENIKQCSESSYSLQVDQPRKNILETLSVVNGKTEQNVMAVREVSMIGSQIMLAYEPENKRISKAKLVEEFDSQLDNIRLLLKFTGFPLEACTYQHIDNADLENYIAFRKTPAGTQFGNALMNGVHQALAQSRLSIDQTISDISN